MKLFFTVFVSLLATLTTTVASAHTGMDQSSILHSGLHIVTTVSIYLAVSLVVLGAGLYLRNKLPKAQPQKIKIRVKK